MSELADFPTIEAAPMPVATQPAAPEPGTLKATALASFVAIRSHAAKLAEKYRNVAYDVTTPKGLAAAKDARLELREDGRFAVQRLRDRLKDEANDLKRVVTDEAEAVIKIIAPVEDAIDGQIKAREKQLADEKAERERIAAERAQKQADGVAGIRAYLSRAQTAADMTAERVGNGIKMLEAMTFAADDWLDPVAAANAQCETLDGMRALHSTLLAREEAAAAAEAQRLENERVAAELAEQKRQADAEQARIAGIMARIAEIRAAATGHERATAADLYEARIAVAALDTSEAVYQEFATLANATQMATLAVLDKFHAEACDREIAAAETQRAARLQEVMDAAKEMERVLSIPLPLTIPEEITEGQEGQQVLKAEGESPDATDRATPADTSPCVGTMGAGHASDEAPAAGIPHDQEETQEEAHQQDHGNPAAGADCTGRSEPAPVAAEPTMTLGDLNAWLAPIRLDSAGLESLGFPAAARRKAALLYHATDKPAIVAALHRHLQGL